jgi:iron complex outermembrane receptor protein
VVDPNLFDVERVEFLRGPQGTLFGSGSLSGAMRILTKSPNLNDFDVSGACRSRPDRIGFGPPALQYDGQRPAGEDKLAMRAVGFYRHEEGYLDNVGTGKSQFEHAGRLWRPRDRAVAPTDRLSIKLLGSVRE